MLIDLGICIALEMSIYGLAFLIRYVILDIRPTAGSQLRITRQCDLYLVGLELFVDFLLVNHRINLDQLRWGLKVILGHCLHDLYLLFQLFSLLDHVEHDLGRLVFVCLPCHFLDSFLKLGGLRGRFSQLRLDKLV